MQTKFYFDKSPAPLEVLEGQFAPDDAFAYQMMAYETVAMKLETLLTRLHAGEQAQLPPEERLLQMQSAVGEVIEALRREALYLQP